MLTAIIAGLRAQRLRLVLSSLAITLGVAFVAGTFVLTDSIQAGFTRAFAADATKVDVAVLPGGQDRGEVPYSLLAKVREVPGVGESQGVVSGTAALVGRDGKAAGSLATAGVSIARGRLGRAVVTSGTAPVAAGQAVLDENTAQTRGFAPGDTITVLDHEQRPHRFRLVGLIDVGANLDLNYRGAVGFTPDVARTMTGEKGLREIDVAAGGGTSAEELRAAVARAVGASYRVVTGRQLADELAVESGADTKMLTIGLLAFGLVALLVAAMVIYNTFTILVAQRLRELALLRCVGATKGQVFGSVLAESAVVGLIASVAGLLLGYGLGAGALALFGSAAMPLPEGVVTLTPRTIVIALVAGLAVTVVAALLPARAATAAPPVAALGTVPERPTVTAGAVRIGVGLLLAAAGVGVTALGLTGPTGDPALIKVVAGGVVVFLAVLVLGPVLVAPLSAVTGWPPRRLFGVPGRLAVVNARRNPRRSATTTAALTVGVGLMTLISVVAASSRVMVTERLDEQFPVEYQIQAQSGGDDMVPAAIAADLRRRPEIASVTEVRRATATVAGGAAEVGTVTDRALGTVVRPEALSGSLAGLRPGTAALSDDAAKRFGARVGDTVALSVEGPAGRGRHVVRVVAVLDATVLLLPDLLVPEKAFTAYFGEVGDSQILVRGRDGVPVAAARRAVEAAARPYPTAQVMSVAEVKKQLNSSYDQMLLMVAALLGLAVIISLLGIANTLALSVHERTRESALLRALGLTRAQLRGMLSVEALILGLIGALVGVTLGLAYGWAVLHSQTANPPFVLPVGQVLAMIGAAGLAGVIAALAPAGRAARASLVGALAS
jgi:putative ABC transport system permease protein